jgi:UDP-GlcNAc:undecaprenyl-phosphate/decaprenyl-phosphate GlcNAc-1-phosphate transferase
MNIVLGFLVAFLMSTASVPLILGFAHRRKLYDSVDERKIHFGNIPRLGGIGILVSFILSLFIVTVITGKGIQTGGRFWAIILCILCVHLLGLVDDFRNLRARYKFFVELAGATLLAFVGFRFQTIVLPFGIGKFDFGAFSIPLTIIWIIGITNAVNLIDGMDGLAGGVSAISVAIYGLFFMLRADPGAALACFALLGAVLGFLVFNLPPAKIFMGDSGALFLGFTLAVLPLIGPASGVVEISFISATTILLIPILDTFSAIIRRMRNRVSVFVPDKSHLHHKLLSLGLSVRSALLVIYGAQFFLCLVALSGFVLPSDLSFVIKISTWILFVVLFNVVSALTKKHVPKEELGAVSVSTLVGLSSQIKDKSTERKAL